jgi:hypothetical protein
VTRDLAPPTEQLSPNAAWAALPIPTLAEIARAALRMPVPALVLVPAKAISICRSMGMAYETIRDLLKGVDVSDIIQGCFDNLSIQGFRKDPELRKHYFTDEDINRNPEMRVEFEHTLVFGTLGDAADLARHKSWGKTGIINLAPLQPGDWLDPARITYRLKATSHMRQRWEWRDTLKAILRPKRCMVAIGRGGDIREVGAVRLVNDAMHYSKGEFLRQLTPEAARTIRDTLDMPPDEFWTVCRYGERRGVGSINAYLKQRYEKTKGYTFDFGEPA